ncbi:MAG: helix-turn-helix transcriptional regulator [Agathobacter sp.]|nr:helix-turn-helix transcriptional regulator [Agathobacter sp.]
MKTAVVVTIVFFIIAIAWIGFIIWLLSLIIRALRKYLKSEDVRKEKSVVKKSLGEKLKNYRTSCKMTQEFVAEQIGVSRQAVSKWENGTSDPSTSNLFALAKLFGISVEELLQDLI